MVDYGMGYQHRGRPLVGVGSTLPPLSRGGGGGVEYLPTVAGAARHRLQCDELPAAAAGLGAATAAARTGRTRGQEEGGRECAKRQERPRRGAQVNQAV